MNTYVSQMKDVLSGFYPQMKQKREEKAEAKERYSADVAAQEIDRIDREATALRNATMDKLQQLHDEGVAQAQRWGNLDGSKLTDDIKLLKCGFDLDRQQVENLVERYRDNGTMTAALASYAGSHGMIGMNIPTVDKKVKAWEVVLLNAKDIMDMCISGTVGWMGGESADKSIRDMIDRFGTSQNPGSGLDIAYKMLEQ